MNDRWQLLTAAIPPLAVIVIVHAADRIVKVHRFLKAERS